MRHLHWHSVGGASGDMILAALLDLGVPGDWLQARLHALDLPPFELTARPVETHGLRGCQVRVAVPAATDDAHDHRAYRDIRAWIAAQPLPARAQSLAQAVFQALAEAEGAVHGRPADDVEFHEVGAVDSLVDVVGACLALDHLGVDGVRVGPLPLGCGTVTCAHGVYPVPAPATALLLRGLPVQDVNVPREMVTPTGAALLAVWQRELPAPGPGAILQIERTGHGMGHADLGDRPNLLRAVLLRDAPAPGGAGMEDCLVLECNLDNTNPELIGALAQRLLEQGALDVFTTAIQMKKQRPGTLLSVLCRPADSPQVQDLIFRESATLGIREQPARRTVLPRAWQTVATAFGPVRVKTGFWQGAAITRRPEMDDCAAQARAHGVAVRVVYEAALAAAAALPAPPPPEP